MVISLRRSLAVAGIGLGVYAAVMIGGVSFSIWFEDLVWSDSLLSFTTLGEALFGVAISVIVGIILSITTVAVGMRSRRRKVLFTLLFAVLLMAMTVLAYGTRGLSLLAFPLLWAVPTAAVGVIRWRWAAIIAGGLAVLVTAGVAGVMLVANLVQDDRNAHYAGPTYGPSTSPQSPLDGYELYKVSQPPGFEDSDGVTVSYQGGLAGYEVKLSVSSDAPGWCADNSSCEVIGEALGQPVHGMVDIGTYFLKVPKGYVEVGGYISPEEALAVFHDLEPMTLDEIIALHTADG
jgi:hypothetical protein